jgi:hypothetical protein
LDSGRHTKQTDCKFEGSALVDTVGRLTAASLSCGMPHELACPSDGLRLSSACGAQSLCNFRIDPTLVVFNEVVDSIQHFFIPVFHN